jgi:hypothetical protein
MATVVARIQSVVSFATDIFRRGTLHGVSTCIVSGKGAAASAGPESLFHFEAGTAAIAVISPKRHGVPARLERDARERGLGGGIPCGCFLSLKNVP